MKEELTTAQVTACARDLKEYALREFLRGPSKTDAFLREWMGENAPLTSTTRVEFERAVRGFLGDVTWEPRGRSRRPEEVLVEFTPSVG